MPAAMSCGLWPSAWDTRYARCKPPIKVSELVRTGFLNCKVGRHRQLRLGSRFSNKAQASAGRYSAWVVKDQDPLNTVLWSSATTCLMTRQVWMLSRLPYVGHGRAYWYSARSLPDLVHRQRRLWRDIERRSRPQLDATSDLALTRGLRGNRTSDRRCVGGRHDPRSSHVLASPGMFLTFALAVWTEMRGRSLSAIGKEET